MKNYENNISKYMILEILKDLLIVTQSESFREYGVFMNSELPFKMQNLLVKNYESF